jgi:ParB-like nuclease domain
VSKHPIPSIQWVESADDLARLEFYEDMAEIEVPVSALDKLPFKNEDRGDNARLEEVMRSIRRDGYNNAVPIIVRLGRRGRWVIVDGGHRLTAARRVSKEFFTNLLKTKVKAIHFLLYKTPLTNTRLNDPEDAPADSRNSGSN